ncbi:MAG: DUF1287 domain-containing protein [Pseudomonadota bacterium]
MPKLGKPQISGLATWVPKLPSGGLQPYPLQAPLLDFSQWSYNRGRCIAPAEFIDWKKPMPRARAVSFRGEAYGLALSKAAMSQMNRLVIYSAKYEALPYPMGDLSPMHGSCSDVVIRAYRALGFDLQEAVYKAKIGEGDKNIDHRRTNTLRTFFTIFGTEIPVSSFPENYKAGDIVTYYRPFSRVSRAHIGIVSHIIAPSGRPYLIHNRGYGVQLEDALFVDRLTGHYRFQPPAPTRGPLLVSSAQTASQSRNPLRAPAEAVRIKASTRRASGGRRTGPSPPTRAPRRIAPAFSLGGPVSKISP